MERNERKTPPPRPWEEGKLSVSENRHYFEIGGRPFFWFADTAWLLFQRLTLSETEIYLRNRKDLGFNIVLADLLHDPLRKNAYGDPALENGDLRRPTRGAYWEHIKNAIQKAEEIGLYVGVLPLWGSCFLTPGMGPEEEEKYLSYLSFVIEELRPFPNIIWILGGDIKGSTAPELFEKAALLLKQDNPDRLIGYHPFGSTDSSEWFAGKPWLDFYLFQSGHRRYDQQPEGDEIFPFTEDNWRYVEHDYSLPDSQRKPTLDGEPSYEWILQGLHDPAQPYWKAADVRRYAYWSAFAGAAGHTFGHSSIMQFVKEGDTHTSFQAKFTWNEALFHEGAAEVSHMVRLMRSVDFTSGREAQELVTEGSGEKYDRIAVFSGPDYLFAYDFTGHEFTLNLSLYNRKKMDAYWMDPVTGARTFLGPADPSETRTFRPPYRENGTDWVLALLEHREARE